MLRSVIGAVVQGLVPEAVQFVKGLQADHDKAHWSVHKAFCETSVREPMAVLPDELSGEFDPGPIVRPHRDVRIVGR